VCRSAAHGTSVFGLPPGSTALVSPTRDCTLPDGYSLTVSGRGCLRLDQSRACRRTSKRIRSQPLADVIRIAVAPNILREYAGRVPHVVARGTIWTVSVKHRSHASGRVFHDGYCCNDIPEDDRRHVVA